MKEYGTDLRKQHANLVREEQSLFAKISRRRHFLLNHTDKLVLKKTGLKFNVLEDNVNTMLLEIIAIERAYTDQAQQLDMFK